MSPTQFLAESDMDDAADEVVSLIVAGGFPVQMALHTAERLRNAAHLAGRVGVLNSDVPETVLDQEAF